MSIEHAIQIFLAKGGTIKTLKPEIPARNLSVQVKQYGGQLYLGGMYDHIDGLNVHADDYTKIQEDADEHV